MHRVGLEPVVVSDSDEFTRRDNELKELRAQLKSEAKKRREREADLKQLQQAVGRREAQVQSLIKEKRELEGEISRQTSVRHMSNNYQSRVSLKENDGVFSNRLNTSSIDNLE